MACNLSLYVGNSSNKSFQKFSSSMSNPLDSTFDTCMMVFLQFVEVTTKQIGVLIFFGSTKWVQ